MTPVQKIQFIKVLIHERALISPAGILKLELKDQPSLPIKECTSPISLDTNLVLN